MLASCGKDTETNVLEEKQANKAPSFKLQDEGLALGERSKSLLEKRVALYFYPKDETPGCTKQACSFRDSSDEYVKENIVVLGINYDSPETHAKFKECHCLTFPLLSDKDGSVKGRLQGPTAARLADLFHNELLSLLTNKELSSNDSNALMLATMPQTFLKHLLPLGPTKRRGSANTTGIVMSHSAHNNYIGIFQKGSDCGALFYINLQSQFGLFLESSFEFYLKTL